MKVHHSLGTKVLCFLTFPRPPKLNNGLSVGLPKERKRAEKTAIKEYKYLLLSEEKEAFFVQKKTNTVHVSSPCCHVLELIGFVVRGKYDSLKMINILPRVSTKEYMT